MTAQDTGHGHDDHGHGSHGHGADAPAFLPDQPIDLDDSDVGAGARTGVWVTGLVVAIMLLLAFFAL